MSVVVRVLARLARRLPGPVIVVAIVLTAVLALFAGQQEMDSGNESFAPDNEQLEALEFAGRAFGGSSDTPMQVLIQGDDVVSPAGLETVAAVEQAVRSALPAEQLGGQPPRGPVVSYLAPVEAVLARQGGVPPELDGESFDRLYREALGQVPPEVAGLAGGLVTSGEDSGKGLVLVFLDTDAVVGDLEGSEASEALIEAERAVASAVSSLEAPMQATAFGFELLFQPDESFQQEVGRLFGTAALVIVVILLGVYVVRPRGETSWWASLRRGAADVLLTLFAIIASIIWMQGLGVLLGPDYLGVIGPFSPPTQIIPILLIGLGVDYAIHLTSRYREEVAEGRDVDGAASRAITTVGVALVLATLTTAIGFLTNITNPIPAIRDFGVLAAVGIVAAFLLMLTVVPAVRILLDRRAERAGRLPRTALEGSGRSGLSRLMARTSILAEHAPGAVLAVTVVLAGLGGYGLTQLSTEFSFTDFLPEDAPLRETFETIQDDFGGGFGERTQVVMRGDVARPGVHNGLVEAQDRLVDTEGVVTLGGEPGVTSPATVLAQLRETPQGGEILELARREGLTDDLTFPADADVGAVYHAMLEAAPQQAGAVLAVDDGTFTAVRATVTTRSQEVGGLALASALEQDFAPVGEAGSEVVATSNEVVGAVIVDELSSSQVSSLAVTLIVALALLIVVFGVRERHPALGAITLAPVALVVLWVFGTMAATGIPFGPVTATMSALAIGIGVPFSIHVTHRFSEDLERLTSIDEALRSTMTHTGGALAGSALTTIAGFLVLVTSSLIPFRQLGLVTAYAIGYALLASVIVLPSLLALWARWHDRRGGAVQGEVREEEPAVPAH